MLKFACTAAALLAVTFGSPAWAIVQETSTTLTSTGTEIPTTTVTITQKDTTGKVTKTDTVRITEKKKVARKRIRIDNEKTKTVEITTTRTSTTPDGRTETKTETKIVDVSVFLGGGMIDLGQGTTLQNGPPVADGPRTPAPPRETPPSAVYMPGPVPTGLVIGGSVGGSRTKSTFRPTEYWSANVLDATNRISESGSTTNFNAGGFAGFYFSGIPFGVEAEFVWLGSDVTIQGLPGNPFAASSFDSITIKKDWMLTISGLYFVPFDANFAGFLKGGLALVYDRTTMNCTALGFCGVAPATAAFSDTTSHLQPGLLLGAGLQALLPPSMWPGHQTYLRIGYEHIFVSQADVEMGLRATRYVSGSVDQDVDRIYVSLILSLDEAASRR